MEKTDLKNNRGSGDIKKAENVKNGDTYAFVNPDEWQQYNLWCIDNLENMIEKERIK